MQVSVTLTLNVIYCCLLLFLNPDTASGMYTALLTTGYRLLCNSTYHQLYARLILKVPEPTLSLSVRSVRGDNDEQYGMRLYTVQG